MIVSRLPHLAQGLSPRVYPSNPWIRATVPALGYGIYIRGTLFPRCIAPAATFWVVSWSKTFFFWISLVLPVIPPFYSSLPTSPSHTLI